MLDINKLIAEAMKEHREVDLRVYRSLKSEILNYKTAKNAKPYDASAEMAILKKMAKQHEDSILQYSQASRDDLVQSEQVELDVIKSLLPSPVAASKVIRWCEDWITSQNFEGNKIPKKSMGVAIKTLQAQFPANNSKDLVQVVTAHMN